MIGRALSPGERRILERLEGRHLAELERELEQLRDELARGERVAELARAARGNNAGGGARCNAGADQAAGEPLPPLQASQASGPEEGGP